MLRETTEINMDNHIVFLQHVQLQHKLLHRSLQVSMVDRVYKRIIKRLKKELKLAENVEERAVRENPLQFDRIKGYVVGIYNALEFVKNDGKEE